MKGILGKFSGVPSGLPRPREPPVRMLSFRDLLRQDLVTPTLIPSLDTCEYQGLGWALVERSAKPAPGAHCIAGTCLRHRSLRYLSLWYLITSALLHGGETWDCRCPSAGKVLSCWGRWEKLYPWEQRLEAMSIKRSTMSWSWSQPSPMQATRFL